MSNANIRHMNTGNRGFTLIEIMVSIAIISILSGVLYANFSSAREEAKNKTMQTEIKETQLALELYKAQYGRYPYIPGPPVPSGCVSNDGVASTSDSGNCGNIDFIRGLAPDFIDELPTETKSSNSACTIQYAVEEDFASWYKLTAINCHTGATVPSEGIQQDDDLARCPTTCAATGVCDPTDASFFNSYAVYSSGGECQ